MPRICECGAYACTTDHDLEAAAYDGRQREADAGEVR